MSDYFTQAFKDEQRREDEEMNNKMNHYVHQLAFGSPSAHSTLTTTASNVSTLATAAATDLYATSTAGVLSSNPYYKKEVDDTALFIDNKLKISAFNVYTIYIDDSMYKIDDMSHISSRYAITEYFNVIYYDKILTPGSKCDYIINDTKNIVKHLNFLTQAFENIAHHKSSFLIGMIVNKWENLHKALI